MCLVDTKWKILDAEMPYEGVSQSDMYQMYAYGKEYGCPFVVLLYPRTAALQGEVATYHHNPGDLTSPSILIRTVDVGARPLVDSEHRPSIRSQLKELLSSVTGPEIKQ